MTTLPRYFIVNDVDKPQMSLVAYRNNEGLLNYVDRSKKSYDGMSIDRATPMEDFGFTVLEDLRQGTVLFVQTRESSAKYRDGKAREWQDFYRFELVMPEEYRQCGQSFDN
jgi:hypothetical protein